MWVVFNFTEVTHQLYSENGQFILRSILFSGTGCDICMSLFSLFLIRSCDICCGLVGACSCSTVCDKIYKRIVVDPKLSVSFLFSLNLKKTVSIQSSKHRDTQMFI